MPTFEFPQAVWKFLDAVQESQLRHAQALELMLAELAGITTLLEELH